MEVGYADLTIAAIAERAGTSKPAIYRRWPSKVHLLHEAAFPTEADRLVAARHGVAGRRPRRDAAAYVGGVRGPVARAITPGLMAEIAADPALHPALLERFGGAWKGFHDRIVIAAERGEVRADADPDVLIETIAGAALMRLLMGSTDGSRRRLGQPHHRPADERDRPMTDRTSPPPPGASCSTRSATWTRRSSRATARSRTTATSPTATGRWRRRSGSRSTPTCSPSRAGRSSSSSTRRSAATGAGAATTPTRTTGSRRSRPTAATGSPATRATRSTSRSPATTSPPPARGRTRSCCISQRHRHGRRRGRQLLLRDRRPRRRSIAATA